MGTLAAVTAGNAAVTGAAGDDSRRAERGRRQSSGRSVEDYANRAGRISQDGLQRALDDQGNGVISNSLAEDVIRAWRNGERVVDKEVIELSDNISSETTLEKNPNSTGGEAAVYQVTQSLTVSAELTIEAGVVVEFQQGTALIFAGGSTCLAEGTANDTILVTATTARRGWYDGVDVNSEDLDNSMEHVVVEYGGRSQTGAVDLSGGHMTLSNCTVRRSAGYGLALPSSAELDGDSGNNAYADNRAGPVEADTSTIQMLSASSSYTGNDEDFVFVRSSSASGTGPDDEQRTWAALEVPYRMIGDHGVDELELVIDPGATFAFTQQSRLSFYSNARMTIEGTAEEPITFTGTDTQRGWWDGIYASTTDVDSVLSNAVVEYGGNGLNASLELGTGFGSQAEISVHDCTFREADGYGLYTGANAALKETGNNTYTGNASGAARIQAPTIHQLSDTSTFTGNDNDWVLVSDNNVSGSGTDDEQRTWPALDVPWRMDGSHSVDDLELHVDGGATFEFTESSSLQFDSGSRIIAEGISQPPVEDPEGEQPDGGEQQTEPVRDEITFTGTDSQRGWWNGLHVVTTDIDNVMDNVVIEYGGASDRDANVEIGTGFGNQGTVAIQNCTFQHAEGYGLWAGNGADIEDTGFNTYTGNSEGAARIQGPQLHQLSDTSSFTGNDNDWVLVSGRNVNADRVDEDPVTWWAIEVPWRVDGDLQVSDVEVVVKPDSTFEFTESSGLTFNPSSVMTVEGTEDRPITFTGTDEQRGWWNGVYAATESLTNTMEHTIVEYGGNGLHGNLEMGTGFGQQGTLSITDCTFRESGGYGLYIGNSVDLPETGNNTYTSNADGAARVKTTQMHMLSDSSAFTGNDNDWVYVSGRTLNADRVDADPAAWSAIDVPFRMDNSNHEISDIELVVDPGVESQFEEQGRLTFASDSTLTIEGTEDEKITLTGTEQIPGWWDGIYVHSESLLNTIDHAIITHGGRGLGGNIDIATEFGHDANLTLTNSEIAHSQSAGVFAESDDPPTNASSLLQDNDFHDNGGGDYVIEN